MNDKNSNSSLLKYAGMATQFFVAIGIAVYGGLKLDQWLDFRTPLFVWVLPLLIISGVIYKIVKDTSKKN